MWNSILPIPVSGIEVEPDNTSYPNNPTFCYSNLLLFKPIMIHKISPLPVSNNSKRDWKSRESSHK